MCYQITELYSQCRCLYYQHAIDRCSAYGRRGHTVTRKAVLVGHSCPEHNEGLPTRDLNHPFPSSEPRQTLKQAVQSIRKAENVVRPKSSEDQNPLDSASMRSRILLRQPSDLNDENPSHASAEDALAQLKFLATPSGSGFSSLAPVSLLTALLQTAQEAQVHQGLHNLTDEILDDDATSIMSSVFEKPIGSSTALTDPPESLSALEFLTNSLVWDTQLQYLWPRLFLQVHSMESAHQQITRLIFRYSLDLQALAENMLSDSSESELKAARFIERNKQAIALELCKEFRLPGLDAMPPTVPALYQSGVDSRETNEITQQDGFEKFETFREFLFGTDPFYWFRANVRFLVEQPLHLPMRIRALDAARKWAHNMWSSLYQSPVPRGKQRLLITCKCGQHINDDYQEYKSGALDELQLLLRQHGIVTKGVDDLESNSPHPSDLKSDGTSSQRTSQSKLFDIRLPTYWQNKDRLELGTCRRERAAQNEGSHNYILACFPFGRLISKLYQAEVCTVDSDQDFFSLLRILYKSSRSRLRFSILRRVKSIQFVQFEMYGPDLADIRCQPDLPPASSGDQYVYHPMPPDLMPPIGSNLMVHLLEHPTHAGVLPDLYKRIPKKLRQKLSPGSQKETPIGWGLAITEGVDILVFFLCGCAGFLSCLLASIIWSVTRSDVQGGFGIGAFLLSFMIFCGGLIHAGMTRSS